MTKLESSSLQRVPPTLAARGRTPERLFDDRSGSVYAVPTAGSTIGENAIAGAALAQSGGIRTVFVLGHASCACLNLDAETPRWLSWPLQPVIDATSDSEADRLDHCIKKMPIWATRTLSKTTG